MPARRRATGWSAVELLIALGVLSVLVGWAAPSFVRWRQRQQLWGAARDLALRLRRLQWAASASGRAHALALQVGEGTLVWRECLDGDGDGVRRGDVDAGIDPCGPGRLRLGELHPGVEPGRPPGAPPLAGGSPGSRGVAFGRSGLVVWSPDGSATAGTLYLRGGGHGAALRIYGPTGRLTTWWWEAGRGPWELLR